VQGTQIGLLNLSREASGANVGISISKSVTIRPVVWASSSTFRNANIGVRIDMRWLYAQTSIGYVDGSGFNDWATPARSVSTCSSPTSRASSSTSSSGASRCSTRPTKPTTSSAG